jgi:hypothetical protein
MNSGQETAAWPVSARVKTYGLDHRAGTRLRNPQFNVKGRDVCPALPGLLTLKRV